MATKTKEIMNKTKFFLTLSIMTISSHFISFSFEKHLHRVGKQYKYCFTTFPVKIYLKIEGNH